MVLTEMTSSIELDANALSFLASIFIFTLFYYQFKKYETQMEQEEMIEQFLMNEEE
ncbi:MAG: hypothetical protein NVS9B7_04750 [Flavisolibacter sp.]